MRRSYPGWSGCWSARWWCVCWGCWGPNVWPTICPQSPVWWISWKREAAHWSIPAGEGGEQKRRVAAPSLTCPRTCVSGSQRAPSASCRSPGDRRSGVREPAGGLKLLAHAASCSPYFISFERRPDQDDGSHGGDHVVGRDVLHLHQDKVPISSLSEALSQRTSRA